MDLFELRSFIESQKARLQQEREALVSQRNLGSELRGRGPEPEDWLILRSQDEEPTNPINVSSKDEINASDVSDALCERINNLNRFKTEVFTPETSKSSDEILSGDTLPTKDHDVEINNFGSRDQNLFPKSLPEQNQSGTSKEATISQLQSTATPFLSRDEEIERLQEKLSSSPFWDNFGRSATSKKWSSNAQDTMVRVGEFSPANPDLQAPGKALLGLGEYEERRRQLLEKKKQEYKDYLLQTRNSVQRTDHLQHPMVKSNFDVCNALSSLDQVTSNLSHSINSVDAATQTDSWFIEQNQREFCGHAATPTQSIQATLSVGEPTLQPLSPRVPRAHSSQTTEQLPDARLRQLQLQEELRLQIEEKRRLEAGRREQEKLEEEALQRRVAEQQARLQAEYERDEKLRQEREIQKQQQIEEFQRRQEELRAESEAIKLEERRQKLEAVNHMPADTSKGSKNAHLVPPSEPAPLSILKSTSPPLRSPRRAARSSQLSDEFSNAGPPSPRALIKVLEGPNLPKHRSRLEDSLPIPLMPVVHSHVPSHRSPRRSPHASPHRSPRRSPHVSPHRSPRRSPSRFVSDEDWPIAPAPSHLRSHPQPREPSEAMRNLEERWKVPAVQKNVCVRGKSNVQDSNSGNVLTQLGAFRRQLQMEHMRMEEKVREKHQPHQYQQQYYQQHVPQRNRHN